MAETVGGYYCRTCGDVALAKRGVDPAQPLRERRADGDAGAGPALGVNQPGPPGATLGGRLDLRA